MEPLRFPANRLSMRAKALELIRERSFSRGRFVLASGRESEFYLDMKPTMFHPEGANLLAELILQKIAELQVDYIGGLEMGAVPLIAAVNMASHHKGRPLPGFFVRKKVKDHGTRKRVDGVASLRGKNVVILEDVTTSGGSAMEAVEAVRESGGTVVLVLSIVDRNEGAAELYGAARIPFDWLFRVDEFVNA